MTLRDYWRVIIRRSWIVIAAIIATAAPAIALSLRQDPIYSADADMLIRPLPGESVFGSDQQTVNADRRIQNEISILEGDAVYARVKQNLGLDDDPPSVDRQQLHRRRHHHRHRRERRPGNGGHAGQRLRAGVHRREARTDRQRHGRRRQRTADQDHRDPRQDRRPRRPDRRQHHRRRHQRRSRPQGAGRPAGIVPRTHRPTASRRCSVGRQRRTGATRRRADRTDQAHTRAHGDARRWSSGCCSVSAQRSWSTTSTIRCATPTISPASGPTCRCWRRSPTCRRKDPRPVSICRARQPARRELSQPAHQRAVPRHRTQDAADPGHQHAPRRRQDHHRSQPGRRAVAGRFQRRARRRRPAQARPAQDVRHRRQQRPDQQPGRRPDGADHPADQRSAVGDRRWPGAAEPQRTAQWPPHGGVRRRVGQAVRLRDHRLGAAPGRQRCRGAVALRRRRAAGRPVEARARFHSYASRWPPSSGSGRRCSASS